MITKTTTNALVYAQMDLDAAERNRCTVTISNICLKAIGLSLEVWLIKWQSVKVAAAA